MSSSKDNCPGIRSVVVPVNVPLVITSLSHTVAGTVDPAIGESETCNHASNTVAFPGTSNPWIVAVPPWVFTLVGPSHEAVSAVVNGAIKISSTSKLATVFRSAGMLSPGFRCIMNELVLFYEQTHLDVYSHCNFVELNGATGGN